MLQLPNFRISLLLALLVGLSGADPIEDCSFDDTVDLSNHLRLPNGSYMYGEDILIPPDQVGVYDFEELHNGMRASRRPHMRGCLCKERACIRFCCHPTMELLRNGTHCSELMHEISYDPYVNYIYENRTSVRRNAIKDFVVVQGPICDNAYPLAPDSFTQDKWDIYEGGRLLRHYDNAVLQRSEYCLMAVPDRHGEFELTAFNCPVVNAAATVNHLFNVAGIISVLFIMATVVIYVIVPQMRGLLGNCLISYLISLVIGNIILIIISMSEEGFLGFMCSAMGFVAYFCYESSFLWLNAIGYYLWQNSKNLGKLVDESKEYRKFAFYAFGVSFWLTAILLILQHSEISDYYKPGIGKGACWLNTSSWSALIYFFGLNAIIFSFNVFFYMMTALKELPALRKYDELSTTVNAHMKSVNIYALLLLILGISWCFNIGSYLADMVHPEGSHTLLYLGDVINSLEGALIFVVLVVRTNALNILRGRKPIGNTPNMPNAFADLNTSQI